MENHELHNPPPVSLPPAPSPTLFNQAQPAINFTQLQPEDQCHCVLRLVGPLMACVLLCTTVCWSLQAWRNQCRSRDQIDWNDQVFLLTGGSNGLGKVLGETLPSNT
ncbi:hypothetical protein PtA15_15A17 [Puccinia triticina]|uniref:Ketoreductase (KR) domain-containing protein n=1 Tax=Puccinia triticina TaxID=208348 RepID=A0ABY7D209_9BASI|nr:uncharacterized protein PtA15_15A17 [Puccinia triticina]WAQ91628.1 hypothetical protein PtA15_15A17 [Puccinia triticina]